MTQDSVPTAGRPPRVVTMGCRLNSYESALIEAHLTAAGDQTTIVVNTCAVTAEAERQARQTIRRLHRDHPGARLVVTGCAAQIDPAAWSAMPEVAQVVGNAEKLQAGTWAAPSTARVLVNDIMAVRETAGHLAPDFIGRTRAFLQVQNGCDHRCTFCIIPYGRGPSRSVPVAQLVSAARSLVAQGYQELVLTGVDLTSYGPDLPGHPTLGQAIRRLLALVPDLPRLRLSSLDPVEIDQDLWDLIATEPRLMPHLHLSMQAASDLVLKRMKRRHLRADLYAVVERALALRPDMVFGADLIAGFPTETDAMAVETHQTLRDLPRVIHTHIFPYSARRGTPAARMPQVPLAVRRARAAALRAQGEANLAAWQQAQLGQRTTVLVEEQGLGRTPHFAPARLPGAAAGTLVPVRLGRVQDGVLTAEPLLDLVA